MPLPKVTPPSVHQMVLALERASLIRRKPGVARSIEVLVNPKALPPLNPRHQLKSSNPLCRGTKAVPGRFESGFPGVTNRQSLGAIRFAEERHAQGLFIGFARACDRSG